MGCGNMSEQYVPKGFGGSMRPIACGNTDIHGNQHICNKCQEELSEQYPQGWRHTPGDVCCHGTYVGDAGGVDYLCGECENGELWDPEEDTYPYGRNEMTDPEQER